MISRNSIDFAKFAISTTILRINHTDFTFAKFTLLTLMFFIIFYQRCLCYVTNIYCDIYYMLLYVIWKKNYQDEIYHSFYWLYSLTLQSSITCPFIHWLLWILDLRPCDPAAGPIKSLPLLGWLVGWLVNKQFFSKTVQRIFLIFCMDVQYNKAKKRTRQFFRKKFGSFKNHNSDKMWTLKTLQKFPCVRHPGHTHFKA